MGKSPQPSMREGTPQVGDILVLLTGQQSGGHEKPDIAGLSGDFLADLESSYINFGHDCRISIKRMGESRDVSIRSNVSSPGEVVNQSVEIS